MNLIKICNNKYHIIRDMNKKQYDDFYVSQNNIIFFHPDYKINIDENLIQFINNNKIEILYFIDRVNDDKCLKIPDIIKKTHSYQFRFIDSDYNLYTNLSTCVSIKKIYFGESFDHDVDKLPPYLIELRFGNKFNKDISQIPKTIEILELGDDFDKEIKILPFNLK